VHLDIIYVHVFLSCAGHIYGDITLCL